VSQIVSDFNDAVSAGIPQRLYSANDNSHLDIIPFVPQNAFAGTTGRYYTIAEPRHLVDFDAAKWSSSTALKRVANVNLLDPAGAVLHTAPHDLRGCFLEFTVRGIAHGDRYRVEIFPDPTGPGMMAIEISQLDAGTHTSNVQHFRVALERGVRAEVALAIYRVDSETAKRDRNSEGPKEWEEFFRTA